MLAAVQRDGGGGGGGARSGDADGCLSGWRGNAGEFAIGRLSDGFNLLMVLSDACLNAGTP